MNVLFKCCQCNREIRKKVHSYSWNKEGYYLPPSEDLCKHFSHIELSWKTRYGFFTLGWKVEIYNVSVKCSHDNRYLYFNNQTFSKNYNKYEEIKDCCDNYIIYYADENNGECSDAGMKTQRAINEIKELNDAEEKQKKMEEELDKLEKEEKLRREKEEKRIREREKKLRNQFEKKNKIMIEIIKEQEKEMEKLDKRINFDTSFIDVQISQMISSSDVNYSQNIIFNAEKKINQNLNYQVIKK